MPHTLSSRIRAFLALVPVLARQLHLQAGSERIQVATLRGVWGAALHLVNIDAWRAVFEGMPGPRGATPGYMFRMARAEASPNAIIDYILLGHGVYHAETCDDAWEQLQHMGLGKRRTPVHITQSLVLDAKGDERTSGPAAWTLNKAVWPSGQAACVVSVPTPLRLLRQGILLRRPDFTQLVSALCWRVEALLPWAERSLWRTVTQECLHAAGTLPHSKFCGQPARLSRYSARQGAEITLEGVMGQWHLPEGPGELEPLLASGQWIHAGKGTVFGLGQLQGETHACSVPDDPGSLFTS